MASWFPNSVLRGIFLFQTTIILWHSNLHGTVTATVHMVSCHTLSSVRSKKSKPVGHCLWSAGGIVTCSRTILLLLQQSSRTISLWGPACMQRWKNWRANTSRKKSETVLVAFFRSLPALYYQLLLRVPNWVRASVVFVPMYLLGRWPFGLLSFLDGLIACGWAKGSQVSHHYRFM